MKVLVIHGPNLNMLGKRDKSLYGHLALDEINSLIKKTYKEIKFDFYQSNHEGNIIDLLHNSSLYDFLIINPGGLCHYSVTLRDAFELVSIPKAVVHLSNIKEREPFRQIDLLKSLADVYVTGLKEQSYITAIKEILSKHFNENL
ncbi:MAG: type II 3-dehydroquinate dehydratase [Acholeplasmatales bacterium]